MSTHTETGDFPTYFLRVSCPDGHVKDVQLFHPTVNDDGTVEGAAGSDATYCYLCDLHVETEGAWIDYTCQWFAGCENVATAILPHPILGPVNVCKRCADFAQATS